MSIYSFKLTSSKQSVVLNCIKADLKMVRYKTFYYHQYLQHCENRAKISPNLAGAEFWPDMEKAGFWLKPDSEPNFDTLAKKFATAEFGKKLDFGQRQIRSQNLVHPIHLMPKIP